METQVTHISHTDLFIDQIILCDHANDLNELFVEKLICYTANMVFPTFHRRFQVYKPNLFQTNLMFLVD